jgi:hypothetical protein
MGEIIRASQKRAGGVGSTPTHDHQGVFLMAPQSLAHPAQRTTHPKPPSLCAGCGDPAGSVSQGTGYPLVRDKESGLMHHVRCLPGTRDLDAVWSALERMGG